MSLCTTTNVHHVVGVKIERCRFSDFRSLRFTFTTADGSTISLDAFSAEPLDLIDCPEVSVEPRGVAA